MKNINGKKSGIFSDTIAARIIVALICMCLLGGLMIYSFKSALNRNEESYNDSGNVSNTHSESELSVSNNIPVTDSADSSENKSESEITAERAEEDNHKDISVMPAEGNIIRDYSGDGLVYSETLNQYLAHKAVDIGAPVGTDVIAAESGTIIAVTDDDRYGLTVVLSHGGGLETSYSNLSEASVSEGDVVNKGDKIGTVGQDSLFESADDPHLHFSVHRNNEPINPHKLWNW